MNFKQKYFQRLNILKNNSSVPQLLYAAEKLLEHASLIGWENDTNRLNYRKLQNKIKENRINRRLM